MTVKKTRDLIREGFSYWRIANAIRCGKLDPPGKDVSGDYLWTEEDIQRLREVLDANSRQKEVPA